MEKILELKNICFSYNGGVTALEDISLDVCRGEALVLKGPNGCGKSTLLSVMNGILQPESGEYFIYGDRGNGTEAFEVTEKNLKDTRFSKWFYQQCGFIFQNSDIQLFCGSVEEEIEFGPIQMGLDKQEIERRTEDVLQLLQIEHLRDRAPYQLSGGEKRKVAIACILSMNPSILMLDEPLAGLDNRSQEWLTDFLLTLKETGKTIVISTHNNSLAGTVADRIVHMDEDHGISRIENNR